MIRVILRIVLIVFIGAGLGLAWNAWSGKGFPLRANALVKPGDEEIDLAEAKKRFDKGYLFLDARPFDFYAMEHITGALPLPEDDFDKAFAKLEPRLRASLDIVLYCSGFGCPASHNVSRKLKEKGIPAAIMPDGWPGWTEAGYPTKKGQEP
jgi:rhodanese-related sulfurtransferase